LLSFTSCSFFGKKKRKGWKPKSYAYDKNSHRVDGEDGKEEKDKVGNSNSVSEKKKNKLLTFKRCDNHSSVEGLGLCNNKTEKIDSSILKSKASQQHIENKDGKHKGGVDSIKHKCAGDSQVFCKKSSQSTYSKGNRFVRSIPEMSHYQMLIGCTNKHVYLRDLRTRQLYSMDRNTGKIERVDENSINVLLVKHSKWKLFHNPIIAEDELIIGSKLDNLHIVSLETNKEIDRPRINCSSPLVYSDGMLYTSDGNKIFRGINLKDREVVWESLYSWGMNFEPVVSEDYIFFGDNDGKFYAIDKKTGKGKWTSRLKKGTYRSAYIYGGNIYVVDSKKYVHVFDMKTGKEVEKYYMRLFLSCVGIVNGRIFLGAGCKSLYAIDLKTDKVIWKFKADVHNRKKLFIKDGIIYTGSRDGNIFGIDLATGEKKWQVFTAGVIYTTPVIKDGVMYIGDSSDKLYAIDMKRQKIKWEYSVPGDIKSDVVVKGGYVYLVTNNGVIYTIDITEGDLYCRHILNILNKRTSFNY
jgi:outer membrane protein assembly factor BamB